MTTEKPKEDRLQEVGASAMSSIRDMVAALQCDYDRLEELRDERDGWEPDEETREPAPDAAPTWASENPDEAAELAELEAAASATGNECTNREDAEQQIQEDALSVEFRTGWTTDRQEACWEEARILLATGGPAVQIMVELQDGEPRRAYLQVQDWGTPWTDYYEDGCGDVLLAYCQCFYFGE